MNLSKRFQGKHGRAWTIAAALAVGLAAGTIDKDIMNLFVTNSAVSIDGIKSIIYISIAAYVADIIIGYVVNLKLFGKGVNVD